MESFCDPQALLRKEVIRWIKYDQNQLTVAEIKKLVIEKKTSELIQKLTHRLSFGTAGLRGKMGAGYSCMNELVIIQTGQGFLEFLKEYKNDLLKSNGLVIGYDGRHNSQRFAEITATIFVNQGYPVRLFSEMVPTPFVPFAVRRYGCASGVVISGCHNPKGDNGYKVYGSNGVQIIFPEDMRIQQSILNNLKPLQSSWNIDVLRSSQEVTDPLDDIGQAYLQEVIGNAIQPEDIENNKAVGLKFVYSAMHGVGYEMVQKVVNLIGVEILPVPEQRDPDPEFSTVEFPNPEKPGSLKLSFEWAAKHGSTLILANDPDADRCVFAEKNKNSGEWRIFNGNEIGALFGWWLLECHKRKHPEIPLSKVYMISSTVSSMILKTMAKAEGFNFVDTLSGFRYIGHKAIELENEGFTVIYCFEESIGFMCNNKVLDKDGISALAHFTCLANVVYGNNQQLRHKLDEIYTTYGLHLSLNSYYYCHQPGKIYVIFQKIRNYRGVKTYPTGILNDKYKIVSIRDLTTGYDSSQPSNKAILSVAPNCQMITFIFDNGLHITLKSSGTEPKIKYYSELCASPEVKNKADVKAALQEMVPAICEEYLEPEKHGLIAEGGE